MPSESAAPRSVLELVQNYRQNSTFFGRAEYKEARVRGEFIDPLFKALGWDVDNKAGSYYPDVIREDTLRDVQGITAPDYAFMVGPARKFFIEAKRPHTDIERDRDSAYQLRQYAWSAKLPLSVLTNFRTLAIYDTRVKPTVKDDASVARLLILSYEEFEQRWSELADLLSREAVWRGSIDRFASSKTRAATRPVDDDFLAELERWRLELAKDVSRNNHLTDRQLRIAVQLLIDRILFMRISEARGMEDRYTLEALVSGQHAYQRLCEYFKLAEVRFNSDLFATSSDVPMNSLVIRDEVLKGILRRLYPPVSDYAFGALPVEILGHAYERFLGRRIIQKSNGRLVIEQKPEIRKRSGVYYTPDPVVRFMVREAMGGVWNRQSSPPDTFRVLDPACGSGSFLLAAYQFLLDWYLYYYVQRQATNPKDVSERIYPQTSGDDLFGNMDVRGWRLTTKERKRILVDHIFGVDIDPQAVEVSKLSLLLKCLEGETSDTLNRQIGLFRERALPELDHNIRCGNSLVEPDYFRGEQLSLINEERYYSVNPFDWQRGFPQPMATGGFDLVIGNPPYVLLERDNVTTYLRAKYRYQEGKPDLYRFFIERALQLTRPSGRFAFIVPLSVSSIPAAAQLRSLLLKRGLYQIIDIRHAVFGDVAVNSLILFASDAIQADEIVLLADESRVVTDSSLSSAPGHTLSRAAASNDERHILMGHSSAAAMSFAESLEKHGQPLLELADYTLGAQIYHNSIHMRGQIDSRAYHANYKASRYHYPESGGRNVARYHFNEEFPEFVSIENGYNVPQMEFFSGARVLVREIVGREGLVCAYTDTTHVSSKALVIVKPTAQLPAHALLAVLNSRVIGAYVRATTEKGVQRLFPRISLRTIRRLPMPRLNERQVVELDRLGRELTLFYSGKPDAPHVLALARASEDAVDKLLLQAYQISPAIWAELEAGARARDALLSKRRS